MITTNNNNVSGSIDNWAMARLIAREIGLNVTVTAMGCAHPIAILDIVPEIGHVFVYGDLTRIAALESRPRLRGWLEAVKNGLSRRQAESYRHYVKHSARCRRLAYIQEKQDKEERIKLEKEIREGKLPPGANRRRPRRPSAVYEPL